MIGAGGRCRNDERDADDDRANDDAERDVLIVFKLFAHGKRRDFDDDPERQREQQDSQD